MSLTAAWRDLSATASDPCAIAYSALARNHAVCAAAAAAATMALKERMPGVSTARAGARSTELAKERHLKAVLSVDRAICSVAESQVRLTWPEVAKRRAPRPAAEAARSVHSAVAREATAAAMAASRGQMR